MMGFICDQGVKKKKDLLSPPAVAAAAPSVHIPTIKDIVAIKDMLALCQTGCYLRLLHSLFVQIRTTYHWKTVHMSWGLQIEAAKNNVVERWCGNCTAFVQLCGLFSLCLLMRGDNAAFFVLFFLYNAFLFPFICGVSNVINGFFSRNATFFWQQIRMSDFSADAAVYWKLWSDSSLIQSHYHLPNSTILPLLPLPLHFLLPRLLHLLAVDFSLSPKCILIKLYRIYVLFYSLYSCSEDDFQVCFACTRQR